MSTARKVWNQRGCNFNYRKSAACFLRVAFVSLRVDRKYESIVEG